MIALRQAVVVDGNLERLVRIARIKRHGPADGSIISGWDGRAVGRRVEAHRAGVARAALARDVYGRHAVRGVLQHRVEGGRKTHRAVVIQDRQRRRRLVAQTACGCRAGQHQAHRQIGRDDIVVHHRNRHRPQDFSRRKINLNIDVAVIDISHRRAVVGRRKIDEDVT